MKSLTAMFNIALTVFNLFFGMDHTDAMNKVEERKFRNIIANYAQQKNNPMEMKLK